MDTPVSVWALLAFCVVSANLPFVSGRVFLLLSMGKSKGLAIELLEWLVWCALCLGFGLALEAQAGGRHPQRWEFYAVFISLFATLAFPGFVWRHLRKPAGPAPSADE